jgi:hypothetical protein
VKSNGALAPSEITPEVGKLLTGILAVLVSERDERLGGGDGRPTAVILAEAGLTYGEIAQVTGRPYETIKSAVRRSRTSASGGS